MKSKIEVAPKEYAELMGLEMLIKIHMVDTALNKLREPSVETIELHKNYFKVYGDHKISHLTTPQVEEGDPVVTVDAQYIFDEIIDRSVIYGFNVYKNHQHKKFACNMATVGDSGYEIYFDTLEQAAQMRDLLKAWFYNEEVYKTIPSDFIS